MSTIYLAHDPRSNRDVAIKVLPPFFAHSEQYRERYKREATTIASLEHPAIVPIYDLGEEQGQPYIVMRYMSGGSLTDRLKQGPIPPAEVKTMITRLATALDAAHARGIVHRDIKPDNILFDSYGTVFLTDFGLARLRETPGLQHISDGFIMGTPAYMSPEQIQGQKELDGRSDIYSLGVVLYHMLTGQPPYSGGTAASVMMMHLINPVPNIYEKMNTLPPALQSVLNIAMAKEPRDRYQTAGEMARALEEVVDKHLASQQSGTKAESEKRWTAPTDWSKESPPTITIRFPELQGEPVAELRALAEAEAAGAKMEGRAEAAAPARRRRALGRWYWLATALLLMGGLIWLGSRLEVWGGRPPAASSLLPSPLPALGGADQIAFLSGGEIWVSNVDGTGARQISQDKGPKSNLQWSPDGEALLYTSARCLYSLDVATRQRQEVVCFEGSGPILGFEVSPDGGRMAISLDERALYVVGYEAERLAEMKSADELRALAECQAFAPYQSPERIGGFHWAGDGRGLAVLTVHDEGETSRQGLLLLDFSVCGKSPLRVGEIQPTHLLFNLRGYYLYPEISGFGWDGQSQAMVSGANQEGFGDWIGFDLQNLEGHPLAVNGEECCYRHLQISPDGQYWLLAYRAETGGQVELYYAPWTEMRPGANLKPLALPAGLETGGEVPQAALRRASGGAR